MNIMKNKELAKLIGITTFVFFSGMLVIAFHSASSQTFSRGIDGKITDSSLDIQKIKREMNEMNQEEIEETIRKIEREIDRLNSDI